MGMGAPPVLGALRSSLAWDLCLSKDGLSHWSLCLKCSGPPRLAATCCMFSDRRAGQHFIGIPRRTLGDGI